mgnify:FL=1|tara:strand:- start:22 stop:228 length:207 start_codon:yes stop_codon:yes gene_type:complete
MDEYQGSNIEDIRTLVYECMLTHNEEIVIELIARLEKQYIDVSRLATLGEYNEGWSHEDVLNYMTYET